MKYNRDERKFDFHDIGLEIKHRREERSRTQEQLSYVIDHDPRTVMYHKNDGKHQSLDVLYQITTMFGISVNQFFYSDMSADEVAKKADQHSA